MVYFMPRAVIFVNGRLPQLELTHSLLQEGDTLFAADGGTRHLLALGLLPSVIIGDLDSLSPDERRSAELAGVHLVRHPCDKDETDFELALDYAIAGGYKEILVVAALGDRLDQTLGNLALLSAPRLSTLDLRLDDGVEQVFFTRTSCQVRGLAGDLLSLIPWGGPVTGIVTAGLRWPLQGETLLPDKTRGISNELLGETASISLESGLLLIVLRRQNTAEK
jgi:thiamine pyrophosphokinase